MSKKIALAVCLVVTAGTLAFSAEEGEPAAKPAVAWRADLAEARAEAKRGGGLMVVYLTRGNCPWCTKMEKETLADGRVIAALGGFVPVKVLDAEERGALMQEHALRGVPSTLVLGPGGAALAKIVGYRPAPAFLAELEKAKASHKEQIELAARVKANPEDLPAVLKLAELELERGRVAEAVAGFASARMLDTAKKYAARIDMGEAVALMKSGEAAEGRKLLGSIAEKYPDSPQAPQALFALGTAVAESGDMAGGEKELAKIVDKYPKSAEAPQALFIVGVIQARTGRMKDALKSFQKIVDEHKESPLAPRAAGVIRALEAQGGAR